MRHRVRFVQPCKQPEPPNWNRLDLCLIQWLQWFSKGVHHQTRQTTSQVVGFLLQNPNLPDPTVIFLHCLNIHLDPPSPSQSPPKLAQILQFPTIFGGDLVLSRIFFVSISIWINQVNPNRHLKTNSIWSVFSPIDGGCCYLPPDGIRFSFGCVQTQTWTNLLTPLCRIPIQESINCEVN